MKSGGIFFEWLVLGKVNDSLMNQTVTLGMVELESISIPWILKNYLKSVKCYPRKMIWFMGMNG